MKRNLSLFIITLYFLTSFKIVKADIISFTEELDPSLRVLKLESYLDNTVVVRVVKNSSEIIGNATVCRVPDLTLRIIHPNNTITNFTVTHEQLSIEKWNFCR